MASVDPIDIFLPPGGWFVGDDSYRIRTLLGSCVSITLWHSAARLGAMSHFLLPTRGGTAPVAELDGRYGDEALQLVLDELRAAGVPPVQCQAKIFGGGNMFPGLAPTGNPMVGQRNGEAARALLQAGGITVVSESLFGIGHRQILFEVATGDVWSYQVAHDTRQGQEDVA
ncbi:chemotaxis protein CheD [Ideonella sp. A 288]|uniref:chemotaxis protein CheD n=1 Tax=Ideonella sp. A 288 TaxID=1962181 RepID=UPI0018FEE7AE|nr:chemotaxis protein CheD [Ideonella sp. A 288]